MSPFLNIQVDPVEQPAATDPLEKATWSSVRLRVGARTVSRVLDRKLNDERSSLYIPLFPVAAWMVTNWWALLHEPCRRDSLPPPDAEEPDFSWTRRHCIRTAESDLLLPALYLYNDGRHLRIEWRADSEDALPHMPAFFVDSGGSSLEFEPCEKVLAQFVSDVLEKIRGSDDTRARDIRATWMAIRQADADERAFCVLAGRLGLDPYDPEQVPESLAATLEQFAEANDPLIQDVTTAASATNFAEQWHWVDQMKQSHQLGPLPPPAQIQADTNFLRADRYGYAVAQRVREMMGCPESPLASLEEIAAPILGAPVQVKHENHLVGREIKALAGRSRDGVPYVIGPGTPHLSSHRFQIARGLFHVLAACGPRLVTNAYTWDQRASRAFAAELIAPQLALKKRAGEWADRDTICQLAQEFQASEILIAKQLSNAKVPVADE